MNSRFLGWVRRRRNVSLPQNELRRLLLTEWDPTEVHVRRGRLWLDALVRYVAAHVPYYRRPSYAFWTKDPNPEKLPLLTAADVDGAGATLRSDEFGDAQVDGLSFSADFGVPIWLTSAARERRILAGRRFDRWAGWVPGRDVGVVGEPAAVPTNPERRREGPYGVRFDDEGIAAFLHVIADRRLNVLHGSGDAILALADAVERGAARPPVLTGIVVDDAVFLEPLRRRVEAVLGCAALRRHRSGEGGVIASECRRRNGFHVNADHVRLEVLKPDLSAAAPGEMGYVVMTEFTNRAMPLIRYATGDIALASARRCACGRGLPMVERLLGRDHDFFIGEDGGLVSGVLLAERLAIVAAGVRDLQIIQEGKASFCVRIETGDGYGRSAERRLRDEWRRIFGFASDVSIKSSGAPLFARESRPRRLIRLMGPGPAPTAVGDLTDRMVSQR